MLFGGRKRGIVGEITLKVNTTMERKITWMRYLLIGINSVVFMMMTPSCGDDEDCLVISNFIFSNSTNHIINTSAGVINPNSELSIRQEGLGPCSVKAGNYVPPFLGETKIIFDNHKCLIYQSTKVGIGEGPVGINNYVSKRIGKLHYEFRYEFTDLDYEKAEDCD